MKYIYVYSNIHNSRNVMIKEKQAYRRAAAETVARKPIEHFIHDK